MSVQFHRGFVTTENIERLDGYRLIRSKVMGTCTGKPNTLIMRFIIEKIDDLTSEKRPNFTNADFELTRRSFGDSRSVTICLWEDNSVRFSC